MEKPTMHCHEELEKDLQYKDFIPDEVILKWFNDNYSSSKHLLALYSIARGLGAKVIVEIGFGRSSFVLAKAAAENQGELFSCDTRDFSYLFNAQERSVAHFIHGRSDILWDKIKGKGIDFAFLDYFSSPSIEKDFVQKEIVKCLSLLKQNGIIAIHDSLVETYNVEDALNAIKTKLGFVHNQALEVISLPYNYGLGLIRRVEHSDFGNLQDTFVKKKG